MSELTSVRMGEFAGTASLAEGQIHVRLEGNGDLNAKPAFESFLPRVHQEALTHGVSEVVVDLRTLEFMNSSCFKDVVSWICEVQDLEADKQYQIRFRSNPGFHWQRRSLHVLKTFATDLVHVDS